MTVVTSRRSTPDAAGTSGDEWGDWTRVVTTMPFAIRTLLGISILAVGANIAGAVVVTGLVAVINSAVTAEQTSSVLRAVAVELAGSLVVGVAAGAIVHKRTLRWVLRGQTPTERDTRRVVRMPLDMALIAVCIWTVDALVTGAVARAAGIDAAHVVGITGGVVLAGLISGGVTFLLVARVANPITRIALAVHPPREPSLITVRTGLLLVWLLSSGLPLIGIIMILTARDGRHVIGASVVAALLALVVGAGSTALAARSIGTPLRAMVDVLHRVGEGDLTMSVAVDNVGEIGLLQGGFNDMVAGLRERDRVQDLFGRHVGPAVAHEALRSGVTLSGEEREVVALFVDITESTALTRRTEPAEFVAMLNRVLEVVVDEVESAGGLVNKFEGDAALCLFGAPMVLLDPHSAALRAARRIRDRVRAGGELTVGIGVAAGPVVAGQIGAPTRREDTVIGDAVNEAARLTDLAKGVPGNVIASEVAVAAASPEERAYWADAGEVTLRGRNVPTLIRTA